MASAPTATNVPALDPFNLPPSTHALPDSQVSVESKGFGEP